MPPQKYTAPKASKDIATGAIKIRIRAIVTDTQKPAEAGFFVCPGEDLNLQPIAGATTSR